MSVCWCGMRHAIPSELDNFQQRQHDNGEKVTGIYCPLGHSYVPSGKGEAQRLREKLERERNWRAAANARADQAEASARAHKGHATRAKKRAAAGMCPCCNRSFKQLTRHIASKHPDYEPGENE